MFPTNMVVEVPHNQGGFLICPFQQFVHSLIGFFGGIWHPVANSHQQLRLFKLNFPPDTLFESLVTHIPSLHCIKLLLTYSNTPPAPCPSVLWFSRSFLNNLYPSRASSLSAISGFVHDTDIPILYLVSRYLRTILILLFFEHSQYFLHLHTYILRPYYLWFPYACFHPYH